MNAYEWFGFWMLCAVVLVSAVVSVSCQVLLSELASPKLHRFRLQCDQEVTEIYLAKSPTRDYWIVNGRAYPLETALCKVQP